MHALFAVDRLGDPQIPGEAAQHVGVLTVDVCALGDQSNHVAQGHLDAAVKISVQAHGDVMRWRLGLREPKAVIFEDTQAKTPPQCRFEVLSQTFWNMGLLAKL